jgi:hypothetical protein
MLKLKQVKLNMAVLEVNNKEILFSYGTPVAAFIPGVGYVRTGKKFSFITSKHINKWLDGATAEMREQKFFNDLLLTGK